MTPESQGPEDQSKQFGGFPTQEAQQVNTSYRGMKPDATVEEVNAYDQAQRDLVNAEHFGYPVGTPSVEIGRDLSYGKPGPDRPEPGNQ